MDRRFTLALASLLYAATGCSDGGIDDSDGMVSQTPAGAGAAAPIGGGGGGMLGGGAAAGGSPANGGSGGARVNTGGTNAAGSGGGTSAAGTGPSTAGTGGASGAGPSGDQTPTEYELDCGASGIALESAGPPANRVNYIIVGDAYTTADLESTYREHLDRMLEVRFSEELQPYLRYRRFVNICALKVESMQSGVGTQAGNTAFDGYGNDDTRLGYINDNKVNDKIQELLPAEIEVDWTGVVLNGNRWWNSGGRIMVWSGGHRDAALAAQHEGGHAFQRLADEYGGNCTFQGDETRMRINVTMDQVDTAGKWTQWLEFDQSPGTGMQGTFEGAQYCDRGAWRPSQDSVMNQLSRSGYFNSISLEQAVRIIYEMVRPIDVELSTPASQSTPGMLEARVVDPMVIKVDWSVDGNVVAENGGQTFDVAARGLSSGSHTISARAYDDTEWVRGDRAELEQTLEWTIAVP
jgi:hypothetical protein